MRKVNEARKCEKKDRKSKARSKTVLFVISIHLCPGPILLFELRAPLLVESFIGAIGMIIASPTMKEEYANYQNIEASITVLVRFF